MKSLPLFIIVCVLIASINSCGGPIKMNSSWTYPNLEAKKYNKVGVVMISDNEVNKEKIESLISKEMRALGYPVVPTFSLFPFAGNQEVLENMNMSPAEQQAYIKERVDKFNFDALLVITVLGSEENLKTRPSVGVGVSAPASYYDANYTQYISYANMYVSSPSYYIAKDYYLESSLFDVSSEELHWTGEFDITNPKSVSKISEQFADKLISVLIEEEVLIK
jgi:hypothetical protein